MTPEWLKAVGFNNSDESPEFYELTYPERSDVAFTVEIGDELPYSGYIGPAEDYNLWPHDLYTCDQVRDICRALGVPLK